MVCPSGIDIKPTPGGGPHPILAQSLGRDPGLQPFHKVELGPFKFLGGCCFRAQVQQNRKHASWFILFNGYGLEYADSA